MGVVGLDVEGSEEGPLTRVLKRLLKSTAGRLLAYYRRPRVIFPHKDRGFCGSFKVGNGCVMQERVRIDCTGNVEIGERCRISSGVVIHTHTHAYLKGLHSDVTAKADIIQKGISIGSSVFIGRDALVLSNCREIGDDAIIGARSVLTRNVAPGEIWAGNPARKVGQRSDEE